MRPHCLQRKKRLAGRKKRKQLVKYANKLYEKVYINKLSGTQTFKVQTYAALKNNSFKRSLRWQKKNEKHEGKLIEKNVKFNECSTLQKRKHDPPLWKISEKLPSKLPTGIP